MPNDQLRNLLLGAYLPYAKGFCKEPAQARLELDIDDEFIDGILKLAASDFRRFDRDTDLRAHHRRAFYGLVREHTTRPPSLDFEQR